MPKPLLAKSYPKGVPGGPPASALLVQHSRDVAAACRALAETSGSAALRAAQLGEQLARFERALLACGWIQDIGKANSHFQEMVGGELGRPQALRHEAVSAVLFSRPPLRGWLEPALGSDVFVAIWGAAGHHRKFSPATAPELTTGMRVFATSPDFRQILADMAADLSLPEPPHFEEDLIVAHIGGPLSPQGELHRMKGEFERVARGIGSDERRLIALVKAFGIAADVAASAIPRRTAFSRSIPTIVRESLREGRLSESDVRGVIEVWAVQNGLDPRLFDGENPGADARILFQRRVAASPAHLTLAAAGCGTGKSVAAYLWAAEWAQRYEAEGRQDFRLFFCLPTTGTATEHYRDYAHHANVPARLAHSRASVDLDTIAATSPREDVPDEGPYARLIEQRKLEGLALWSTPIIVATTDTVLGLVTNVLRSLCAAPAILSGAVVFDEVHAFDDRMFGHLLAFLENLPGVPTLLMTASLPTLRLDALRRVRPDLNVIAGPPEFETLPRYRPPVVTGRAKAAEAVEECLSDGGRVLWVANRVSDANETYREFAGRWGDAAEVYHSRFRYRDRSRRHRAVVDAFKSASQGRGTLLVATQVAEMSLDLSADLLVTEEAPVTSMIQRMGRLNRRATPERPGSPKQTIVIRVAPGQERPYSAEDLRATHSWLAALSERGRELSQRDLAEAFHESASSGHVDFTFAANEAVLFSGVWATEVRSVREDGYTVSVILERDWKEWKASRGDAKPARDWLRAHEVAIPWKDQVAAWPRVAYLPIAPHSDVSYDWNDETLRGTGAEWRMN